VVAPIVGQGAGLSEELEAVGGEGRLRTPKSVDVAGIDAGIECGELQVGNQSTPIGPVGPALLSFLDRLF
jgi:hypothetical protein